MKQDEFLAFIKDNEGLRRRFVAEPEAVLREFQVDTELDEAELESVTGGVMSEPALVHSVLTSIFNKSGD